MARVFPGSDFQDIYAARNIVSGNIQGDDYKVRRSANDSNLDPRANSEWQDKIIDAMSLAARIWKNKRNCWKDHFKRASKTFKYNTGDPNSPERVLSGYQLAINMIMKTLKTGGVEFYDPECFCITPTDLFGDPLNVYSVLDIIEKKDLTYEYKEKKLTYDVLQPAEQQFDKFCSAVAGDPKFLEKCLLTSSGCVPRDNLVPGSFRDLNVIKNIVQWPNLKFERVDGLGDAQFGFWNTENFIYEKLRTEDLPVTDGSMRGYKLTLTDPYHFQSLCSLGNLQVTLYTQYENIFGDIQYSNTAPFYDLYYGDTVIGRYGGGGGVLFWDSLNLNQDFNSSPSARRLKFNESINPVIPGYQHWMYPPGKLSEARLTKIELGPKVSEFCQWDRIRQYWRTSDPIHFDRGDPSVQIKFNIWGYSRAPDLPFQWWPYGALSLYASSDGVNYHLMHPTPFRQILDGERHTYCFGTTQGELSITGDFSYFMTQIYTSPVAVNYCGTFLGDPMCRPCPIDEVCLGPCIGQRGLFFLEKNKEFETKPVACRCPEFSCPIEFPETGPNGCTLSNIRRCPDDHRWALIGDECVPCVGASRHGLVYDFLI